MPALSESRPLRLFVLAALYLAQGLPWGFISVSYVVFLTDLGLDNDAIGSALALAYLPWSFKLVAGPFLDRIPVGRFGRRRPVIVVAEFLMGATLLLLLGVDPVKEQGLVSAILFLHNSFAALQDVAVDAMAVDLLAEDERGRANSFMWAGKSAGVAIGGGGGLVIAKSIGWPGLFILLALAIWTVMLLPLLLRERPLGGEAAGNTVGRFDWEAVKRSYGFWTPWAGMLIGLLVPVGYSLVAPVSTRLFRADFKLTEEQLSFLSGVVEPVAGIAGSMIGGFLADRLGARRVMAAGLLVVAASIGTFAAQSGSWPPSVAYLTTYTVILTVGTYVYGAASLGFFMGLSNPAIAATQFAGFMAVTNLTYAWTSKAGGWLADTYGVVTLFGAAAVAQVVVLLLLPLANPAEAAKRFRAVGAMPAVDKAPVG